MVSPVTCQVKGKSTKCLEQSCYGWAGNHNKNWFVSSLGDLLKHLGPFPICLQRPISQMCQSPLGKAGEQSCARRRVESWTTIVVIVDEHGDITRTVAGGPKGSTLAPDISHKRDRHLLGWAISSYQPAILIEMVENEPKSDKIEGEALSLISIDERGGMVASGTFKSSDERLRDLENLSGKLFQYKGLAFEEGSRRREIRAVMFIKGSDGDLFELESNTEPVIVQRLD